MPDLRKDPILGRWVIIAKNRAKRPIEFPPPPALHTGRFCPFCEGNEHATPGEVLAYRNAGAHANREGWRVRVVPNRFPALEIEGDLQSRGEGMYDMMRGVGAHEVIIESPKHLLSTSQLGEKQLREVLWVYRDRLLDLKKDRRLKYGMVFKNVGATAGASLEHTHSQLIALPIVPINVAEKIAGSLAYHKYRGRCVFCDMIQQELAAEKRIVLDTPGFVAFAPFASRFPFETWIVPKQHSSDFDQIQNQGIEDLARVLRQVIGRIESAADHPAYNYVLHTAPFDSAGLGHYHWHIEIIPRLTNVAGFEWGTGMYINVVPPEDAAAFLRSVDERMATTAAPLPLGNGKKTEALRADSTG